MTQARKSFILMKYSLTLYGTSGELSEAKAETRAVLLVSTPSLPNVAFDSGDSTANRCVEGQSALALSRSL
jgi:hypothetical protein